MTLKFHELQKHPSLLTDEELHDALARLADSVVMRTLIMAEIDAIRNGDERETRTMRNLWYSLCKPALSRAGILNRKTSGGKPVPWDAKLSKYLAELVRLGETSYEELRIIDGSRLRQQAVTVTKPITNVQLVGAHFPWVILFTEKDTMWSVVRDVAYLYGVSAISGAGQPSNACTENTIRGIVRSDTYQEAQPERIILLSLTDYDPAGYNISNAQFQQILEAVRAMDRDELGDLAQVQQKRIGLEPGNLTPEQIAQNAYEPKDQGLAEWFEKTGGIDGQPLGLELDALPLSTLRGMFADAIIQHIDLDERRDDIRDAFVDLIACELLKPDFDTQRQNLKETIKQNGAWSKIVDTPLPDALFRLAATSGFDSIDPVALELFDCEQQVRETMQAELN